MSKIGLQLYSIRNEMEQDMERAINEVAKMGYDSVELAGTFGRPAAEVRAMLDRAGLECVSVHYQGYESFLEDPEKNVADLKTLGVTYCAIPYIGQEHHAGGADFEKTVETLQAMGKILKENGITLLYHNHDFEFHTQEGKTLLDTLYDRVSLDLMQTEFDTGWVTYAGYSPVEYLATYAGFAPVVHLKDFTGNTGLERSHEENGFAYSVLGEGKLDVPAILEAGKKAGTECFIVEQDDWNDQDPMDCARQSRVYLKTLGY